MKWRYTNIQHEPRTKLGLNPAEYCVLDIIYQSQTHPRYSFDGWARIGCHKIASFLGLSSGTVHKMFERFENWRLLEFDETREYKRTTPAWYDVAYIEDIESEAAVQILNSVQKVNRGCSKSEQATVQKVNGKRSKSEPKTNKPNIETKEVKETPIGFFDAAIETRIGKKHYQLLCGAAIACNDSTILNFLRESESAEILFDWLEYKKDKRQTYKTEQSVATLIEKKFMPFTPGELRQAYQDSVTANWAGIFPKKQNKKDAKDEPRFGAATHSEIERALEIRRARRQAV